MKTKEYKYWWSRYDIIDIEGAQKRLLKFNGPISDVICFKLLTKDRILIEEEKIPATIRYESYNFGFWISEKYFDCKELILQIIKKKNKKEIFLQINTPPQGFEKPLRLDKANKWLKNHLNNRENIPEASQIGEFTPDMEDYLYQHRLIYERPASSWTEGLILGNGIVGATVTGEKGRLQRFYLDRVDLWGALDNGEPMGRFYGGQLDINYDINGNDFNQELLLYDAEVQTNDNKLSSVVRVNAERDILEIELNWAGEKPLPVKVELTREVIPLIEDDPFKLYTFGGAGSINNGSWNSVKSSKEINKAKKIVENSHHTKPEIDIIDDIAIIKHRVPNMNYTIAAKIIDKEVKWRKYSEEKLVAINTKITLFPEEKVTILASLISDRNEENPEIEAKNIINEHQCELNTEVDKHLKWWQSYWERSFVELPDKLMENLWYFGLYHQASFSRGLQVPSFFGLWHPLDWRTWYENFTSDNQTEMLFWSCFTSNHLELLLSSHYSFASMLKEYLEHNQDKGALIPTCGFPEWAGGHVTFGKPNIHKGSIGWMSLNFWWDYLYTGDKEFLENIGYPMIAACADFYVDDMVLEDDGKYHCVNSKSPEQDNTARDNVYDRSCIEVCLNAAIQAANKLNIETERVKEWQNIVDNLFDFATNEKSLLETSYNSHPYRCHPVVMFGIFPAMCIEPGSDLWEKANITYDILTNFIGHTYEDRHSTVEEHKGGCEPMGFTTAFLLHVAARMRDWQEVKRIYYATVPRLQLKRNGTLSICDPRHSKELTNMSISEALSGQTSGISDIMVQSYPDHVRLFEGTADKGVFRFSGLRTFGAFILSGKKIDGQVNEVVIYSIKGNNLILKNPWPDQKVKVEPETVLKNIELSDGSKGIKINTEAGEIYNLSASKTKNSTIKPVIEERDGPRQIMCKDGFEFEPPVMYFPEDPPFSQYSRGDRIFLGMPDNESSKEIEVDITKTKKLMGKKDWQSRQTAARWLGRLDSMEATNLLVDLANNDDKAIVRYTAGVGLVNQQTTYGLRKALKVAIETDCGRLRREVLKAIKRQLQNDNKYNEVVTEVLSDLTLLEQIIKKNY